MRGAMPSGCRAMRSAFGRSRRLGATPSISTCGAGVGRHDLPRPVHHDARGRVVCAQNPLDAFSDGCHIRIVERPLAVHRGKSCGQQQLVLFAQWNIEHRGQSQHHRPTRCGPPGLDEADVAGRDIGLDREVQLTQPTTLPPLAHQRTEGRCLHVNRGHASSVAQLGGQDHYLWSNCTDYLRGAP